MSKIVKDNGPFIFDDNLKADLVYQELDSPTSMAFLGPNDILVLEKNNGTVQRIINGVKLGEPILNTSVANRAAKGMLGIAIQKNTSTSHAVINKESIYIFLHFTALTKTVMNP